MRFSIGCAVGFETVSYKGRKYSVICDHYNGMIDIAVIIKDGNSMTLGEYHRCVYRDELDEPDEKPAAENVENEPSS